MHLVETNHFKDLPFSLSSFQWLLGYISDPLRRCSFVFANFLRLMSLVWKRVRNSCERSFFSRKGVLYSKRTGSWRRVLQSFKWYSSVQIQGRIHGQIAENAYKANSYITFRANPSKTGRLIFVTLVLFLYFCFLYLT